MREDCTIRRGATERTDRNRQQDPRQADDESQGIGAADGRRDRLLAHAERPRDFGPLAEPLDLPLRRRRVHTRPRSRQQIRSELDARKLEQQRRRARAEAPGDQRQANIGTERRQRRRERRARQVELEPRFASLADPQRHGDRLIRPRGRAEQRADLLRLLGRRAALARLRGDREAELERVECAEADRTARRGFGGRRKPARRVGGGFSGETGRTCASRTCCQSTTRPGSSRRPTRSASPRA